MHKHDPNPNRMPKKRLAIRPEMAVGLRGTAVQPPAWNGGNTQPERDGFGFPWWLFFGG